MDNPDFLHVLSFSILESRIKVLFDVTEVSKGNKINKVFVLK